MPKQPEVSRRELVVPVRRDAGGQRGPTPMAARGPRWRRTSWGYYVPSEVSADLPEQRIVEAAVRLPQHGAVTGWAGLRWQGGYWFSGSRRGVPLLIQSQDIRPQPGIELSGERMNLCDIEWVDGLPVTVAVRSATFEARYAGSVRRAVEMLDMAAYSDLVSADEVAAYAVHLSGWTGAPLLREAAALMEENAWSPAEVWTRLAWELDAGLPRPLCNAPIFDRQGRHIATPDLLDVEAGVAIEYDGSVHLEGGQRRRDRERGELYRAHEIEVVTVLSGDFASPSLLASRFRRARARSVRQPELERSWTLQPPAWWIPTHSVALRRALTPAQRTKVLGYRQEVA